MASFSTAQLTDIDEVSDGRVPFRIVRHHFGIESFGVNAFTGANAGDRIINEHTEDEGHEELYIVLAGRARFEIDGETVDAPQGTLVYVEDKANRTAFAEEPATTLVAVGGTPGKAYVPHGWELWAPLMPLYNEGKYDEAADGLRAIVDEKPYPMLFYNLACMESMAGRTNDAVEHLRRAVELNPDFAEMAKGDSDFDAIRDEPSFNEALESPGSA
jgi:mannose-6-phosphate isomerase-like protein (cupin superfamily)